VTGVFTRSWRGTLWGGAAGQNALGKKKVWQNRNALMTPLCAARNAAQQQDAAFIWSMAIRVAKW